MFTYAPYQYDPHPYIGIFFVNELLKLQSQTIDGNAVETVSARELHTFLEVGRDFSTWIKDRISKYEFVENTDYIMLPKTGELENKGLQGKIEYFVTLDMAICSLIGLSTVSRSMASWKIKTLLVFWLLPKNLMAVAQAKTLFAFTKK